MKSYKAFAANSYRLWLWVAFPIAGVIGCVIVMSGALKVVGLGAYSFHACIPIIAAAMVMIETLADFGFLPGIYNKKSDSMKLFQLGTNGEETLKQGLIGDIVRRVLVTVFFFGINMIMGVFIFGNEFYGMESILQTIEYGVMAYAITTVAVILARHRKNFLNVFLYAYLGAFFQILIPGLLYVVKIPVLIVIAVFLVISIAASVMMVRIAEKRYKEKFYDEKFN